MAAGSSTNSNDTETNITNILSAVQNWVTAQNGLNKTFISLISSNHLNLSLSGVAFSSAATFGTVTTINTSIGLVGGPISTSGTIAVSLSKITTSLSSNTSISNSVYSDGPIITQGTSGVWFVNGTITVQDTAGGVICSAKLWDGTTVIDSARMTAPAINLPVAGSLSGFITNPAGNIKISATTNAGSSSTSFFQFNASGNSRDCTLSAIRIG